MLSVFNPELLSKRNSLNCFEQGNDMTIVFMFLKGHSGNKIKRDVDPGEVQEQDDMLW